MPYTTTDQALRVASALSAVATGCCLRYGVFAQVRRQRPPDDRLDADSIETDDAFYAFYDLYRTLVISNSEDMTQPSETWLICRIAVPEPAERHFLHGFQSWSVEWVEIVGPGAAMVPTDPALLALQTIEGLREGSLDANVQPGAVRLIALPGAVSLDLVAQKYARAKAGLGSDPLQQALRKWGAHTLPNHRA
jgi:hypothetical protein